MLLESYQYEYLQDMVDCIEETNEFIKIIERFQSEDNKENRALLEKKLNKKSENIREYLQFMIYNTPWERYFELHKDLLGIEKGEMFFKIWALLKEFIKESLNELEKNENTKEYLEKKRKKYKKF